MFKKLFSKLLGNDKFCMYCNECGTYNPDVFIEVNDVELGPGWLCKDCFIEETEEEFLCLKEQIKLYREATDEYIQRAHGSVRKNMYRSSRQR